MDDLTGLRLAAIAAAKAQPEQAFENPRVGRGNREGQSSLGGWLA